MSIAKYVRIAMLLQFSVRHMWEMTENLWESHVRAYGACVYARALSSLPIVVCQGRSRIGNRKSIGRLYRACTCMCLMHPALCVYLYSHWAYERRRASASCHDAWNIIKKWLRGLHPEIQEISNNKASRLVNGLFILPRGKNKRIDKRENYVTRHAF